MIVLANVLLFLGGGPALLLALTAKRSGPEGPVGAHMITTPLALAHAIGIGIGIGLGNWDSLGLPRAPLYLALPFYVAAMTVLPIMAMEPRRRDLARVGVSVAVVGGLLSVNGAALTPESGFVSIAGAVGVLAISGVGLWMLAALFVQSQRNQVAVERANAERESEFEKSQSAWQLGEWQKLPPDAELWQLIQFTHAFHPDVKEQCRARIAAMPDLTAAMQKLLGTGWADSAMAYLRDAYPISRAPLAPALSKFLSAECERWKSTLDTAPQPESWFYNLLTYVDVADKVSADGGDLRSCMAAWARLMKGKRGLESLAQRAAALASQA